MYFFLPWVYASSCYPCFVIHSESQSVSLGSTKPRDSVGKKEAHA